MTSKIYAYVDETSQDSAFIVAVVIVDERRDTLSSLCEQIEADTGKTRKWSRTADTLNIAYMRRIISDASHLAHLCFVTYSHAQDQTAAAVETIARAIDAQDLPDSYKATVLYDGLPKNQEGEIGAMLRKRRIRIRKVRGVDDEADPLIRLADAACGLLRDAQIGKPAARELQRLAIRRGVLREV